MPYTKQEIDAYVKIRGRIVGSRLFAASLVGAVFVTLKLFGALTWSWWWITSPFWGGAAYVVLALFGIAAWGALILASQKTTPATPTVTAPPGLKAVPTNGKQPS